VKARAETRVRERQFMAIDQYGQTYHGLKYPRRDLCRRLGRSHVGKMYVDPGARHIGYVIAGLWLEVLEVVPWDGTKR